MNNDTTMITNHLPTAFNRRKIYEFFFFMNNTIQNNIKQIIQDIPNKIGTRLDTQIK